MSFTEDFITQLEGKGKVRKETVYKDARHTLDIEEEKKLYEEEEDNE